MSHSVKMSALGRVREARKALESARDAARVDWREELSGADERRAHESELYEALAAFGAEVLQRLDALDAAAVDTFWKVLGLENERASTDAPAAAPVTVEVPLPDDSAEALPVVEVPKRRPDEPPVGSLLRSVRRPEPVEIDDETRQRLQNAFASGRTLERTPATSLGLDDLEVLDEALHVFGALHAVFETPADLTEEVDRLERVSLRLLERWGRASPDTNRALTSLLTTRMRHAQTHAQLGVGALDSERLDALFRRVSRHSKETQPGYVWGLSVSHRPQLATWFEDARKADEVVRARREAMGGTADEGATPVVAENLDDALRRLTEDVRGGVEPELFADRVRQLLRSGLPPDDRRVVNLARGFVEHLDGSVFKDLRRVVRDELKAEAEVESEVRESPVPADWPHFRFTRGQRAVIVGGDPRPDRVERLRDVFGFASLDWLEDATSARRLDALLQRMRNGSVDVVIVLRAFSSHRLSDAVFAANDTPCLRVLADTYGVHQVRLAIERYAGTYRG